MRASGAISDQLFFAISAVMGAIQGNHNTAANDIETNSIQ
jgi:hypothetical protein